MTWRSTMRLASLGLLLLAGASAAYSQATTSTLNGTVLDTEKASVPAAAVQVVNPSTGSKLSAATDARGYWAIPDMSAGTYQVTVTHAGFKTQVVSNVKIDAGVPATVNVTLQVGQASQTVEVTGGAEVLQTDTAAVSSTIQGAQIHDLPFTSRNVTELVATQPGTQTGNAVRQSLIDGLPQSAISQTLDGINIQDNTAKSGDGIFVAVFPRTDAVEEVTMSTAAAGADSLGGGAVQIKFVTRSGTNQWHGDLFEQNRNQALEANYFFNAAAGLPRDKLNLNEFGGRIGGPILKNKLFIFFSTEAFRLPQSFLITNQNWLTPTAQSGVFTYKDSTGTVQSINLYGLAAAENPNLPAGDRAFATTTDPLLAKTQAAIQSLVTSSGLPQVSRIASNNDYNRYNFSSSPATFNNRNFPTARLDWDINSKNRLSYITNWQTNDRHPDALNGTVAILPGTGTVVGSADIASQIGEEFTDVWSLRTIFSPALTNSIRYGIEGGNVWFSSGLTPAPYAQWNGVLPAFSGYITNPYRSSIASQSKRNTPVTTFNDSISWLRGTHLLDIGFDYSSVSGYSSGNGSQILPTVTLANLSTDPDNSGSTNLFTSSTLPNSNATQRSDAAALYAILTGRVSAITSSASLDPSTNTYGAFHTISWTRQREFGLYVQDNWKVNPNLTLAYGLRYDKQQPFQDLTGTSTTNPGLTGMYGISGIGNLFQPGVETGVTPSFQQVAAGSYAYATSYKLDPTVGFAYQIPETGGLLGKVLGRNAVVRGGFAISNIREGIGEFTGVLGANPGKTLSTAVSPTTTPSVFSAGSVYFSDPSYPTLAPTSLDPTYPKPSYPIPVQTSNNLNDYDPNLKMEYVSSWDFGLQREFGRNTALEIRYVGNHGTDLYRTINLNEVNIFENQFLSQFETAQTNLAIARQTTPKSNNFGNQGLAGQNDVPILATALGTTNNQTTATQLVEGAAGAAATGIAHNSGEMAALVKAGYPANLFVANPATNGSVNLVTNGGDSTYNSMQIELRRRLSHGLQLQGSYVYSKSLTNTGNPVRTLRNVGQDKGPSFSDMRHAFKVNWIYQLPLGRPHNTLARGVVAGWSFAGVARVQSGVPEELGSGAGFATVNNNDPGVVLHGLTPKQLQSEMSPYIVGADPSAVVYYLPQALVKNTQAAYGVAGTLDPSQPYVGPPGPGQFGDRIYLYGPWLSKWDMSMAKMTPIRESMNLEIRLQALNVFNAVNFLLPTQGINTISATNFGQTTNAFRDFSNTNDPGSRTVEFVITLNF
ncbi:MAG TPA: carboxypeptidase regulatory-like domain-containing protein [Terriglobales bacterium]|nr:carboxypeptidase regulatory-like domain-containing protein [Terriglobales bacterium]